jgi:SAM-dependent methyltransferase
LNNEHTTGTDSSAWQPGYIAKHLAEQGNYLEAVSATSILQQVASNAMQLLHLQLGQRVLEVGCGNGVFLPRLAEKVGPAGKVVGIDHAESFVQEARSKVAAAGLGTIVAVEQADVYRLPFDNSTFDAAHCERILMHLDDPDAALREMARVVRPGGVVVAAEPDWAGIRIDHPDRQAFDLVYERALGHRQNDMGLTLFRRMAQIGFVQLRYLPAWFVITDYTMLQLYGLQLKPAVEALMNERAFAAERLQAIIPTLESNNAIGQFYSTGVFHVVGGTVSG